MLYQPTGVASEDVEPIELSKMGSCQFIHNRQIIMQWWPTASLICVPRVSAIEATKDRCKASLYAKEHSCFLWYNILTPWKDGSCGGGGGGVESRRVLLLINLCSNGLKYSSRLTSFYVWFSIYIVFLNNNLRKRETDWTVTCLIVTIDVSANQQSE